MNEQWYLKVGKYKGDWDFEISAGIDWTFEDMQKFRAMCMVAIGQAEEMYRHNRQALENLKAAIPQESLAKKEEDNGLGKSS